MFAKLALTFGIFWEFLEAVVFAAAICIVIYFLLFQPNQVKGPSMFPTFHDREFILTDKITYRMKEPARGDVVVFKSPQNAEQDFIKRVIGLPGETVKLANNHIYINGKVLDELEYLDASVQTEGESFLTDNQEIVVPPDYYFLLGDNRPQSRDSRDFGTITKKDFIGRVFFRYWPISRFGKIEGAKYLNF